MNKEKQFESLMKLELETTKMRHTNFTAILSISFILSGLALNCETEKLEIFSISVTLSQLVFLLGFLFYLFAIFHYVYFHRYSHIYRNALKNIEREWKIEIYRLRKRPKIGPFKFHFDWALYSIGVVYGFITLKYIGWNLFMLGISVVFGIYFLLLICSAFSPEEPIEKKLNN